MILICSSQLPSNIMRVIIGYEIHIVSGYTVCDNYLSFLLFCTHLLATNIGDETLTPDDAIKIVEELLDVQKCLRFFGLKLQLSERIVDAIHTKYHDPHECLYYTIHEFLKRVEPRPTWTFIVNVLRSPLINLPRLAQSIEEKFCKRNLQSEQCKMLAPFKT